ncbi:hypothetical protein [Halosimplex salinum]|uniref:hypothetical protein n=1 Tax=Halosimplex salinum TaxID=1710538 RepID=UPI000F4819FC|nr:hypothetical protein [Halosimplex salinum]
MDSSPSLVEDRSRNAVVSWSLVAVLSVVVVLDVLRGDLLWAVFTAVVVAVAALPAVVTRDRSVVVSWEALALATVPLVARLAGRSVELLTYVSVATLALLVALEIVAFTDAEMPPWFAVTFVVMTTMTVAALWAVVQYHADALLGTELLSSRTALMWDLLGATGVGIAAGVVFEFYFLRTTVPRDGRVTSGGETDG